MKYISVDEVLMGKITLEQLPDDMKKNINMLVPKVNDVIELFGQYRAINSGYRTPEDQARINPSAPQSKHLVCAAVDLEDKDRKLMSWCLSHLDILTRLGLWMENPTKTPTWIHLQCLPPKSGNRIFNP